MFDGDWHLALASYNGGPGRVQRAMKRSRPRRLLGAVRDARYLPRETREYVPLILAAIIVARNPAQYGLTIIPAEGRSPMRRCRCRTPIDLRRVAEWTGELDRGHSGRSIPSCAAGRRPSGNGLRAQGAGGHQPRRFVAAMPSAAPKSSRRFNRHTVKKGETIATIAQEAEGEPDRSGGSELPVDQGQARRPASS